MKRVSVFGNCVVALALVFARGALGDPPVAFHEAVAVPSDANDAFEQPTKANELVPIEADHGGASAIVPYPDMVFCQLYGLQQYGRFGDIVGLAIATTSWNIGSKDLQWFGIPDNRHPFIVSNLYRLANDRFEQIGMSHVKHGFYALGDHQCGGTCSYESGHGEGDWLGTGCTDTYTSALNASQVGLGPRYEINAWTGGWKYIGSQMASAHSHNPIQHRLQVHDADLDPAQNDGSFYYAEGYYLTIDDGDPMNSASWKPVTINSGSPGGTWTFGMTSASTPPVRGWALDAWSGARQTILAQEVPPKRFVSPDGRCVLGARATDLGGGQWHYEYALLNVDMERKVGLFSVPISPLVQVSNVGFHAVRSHDEPYSNDPWTATVDESTVTWSTTSNPIRWATLYNFRFDADTPPADAAIWLGFFEPGTPDGVYGVTTGPLSESPVPRPQADAEQPLSNRFISVSVPPLVNTTATGAPTALRVTLESLHHVDPPYTGGTASDFSSFEGEIRWVGPPTQYVESKAGGETFFAAMLQCTPHYQDWSGVGLLHITGAEVVPSSVYTIENLATSCIGNEDACSNVSDPLELSTGRWGDIAEPFSPPSTTQQPDISDVSALVNKFKNALGAPSKALAAIAGQVPDLTQDINFSHISACVDAFKGQPFPYSGPSSCP